MSEVDGVLIDDDIWVRSRWEQRCREVGKSIQTFASVRQFIEGAGKRSIDRMIPIFIDSHLDPSEGLGEDLARTIYQAGFRNIFLATTMPPENKHDYPHLRGYVSKEPPHWFVNDAAIIDQTRQALLEKMTCEQRCRFEQRLAELNGARDGTDQAAWPLADGSGAYWPDEVLDAWEAALYHNPTDRELEKIIHEAWLETTL